MTWTPARIYLLEQAEHSIVTATHTVKTLIEDVPSDSAARDPLVAANEHLAHASKLIREVEKHIRDAQKFAEAVAEFVGPNR